MAEIAPTEPPREGDIHCSWCGTPLWSSETWSYRSLRVPERRRGTIYMAVNHACEECLKTSVVSEKQEGGVP